MRLPKELFACLVDEHDVIVDDSLFNNRLIRSSMAPRFFLSDTESFRPTAIAFTINRSALAATDIGVGGFYLVDAISRETTAEQFFKWPAPAAEPEGISFASYSYYRPHRFVKFRQVFICKKEGRRRRHGMGCLADIRNKSVLIKGVGRGVAFP
jgi:hypothetical protein